MPWLDPLRTTIRGCEAIIWLAAWLVPGRLRREWKDLWRQKIWHWANFLSESGHLDTPNRLLLARQCWQAFGEAMWIRWDREEFLARKRRLLRSPSTCLVACFVLLLGLVLAGGFIPRWLSMSSPSILSPEQVAVVSFDSKYLRVRSETLLYLGSVWKDSPLMKGFALYSWGPGKLNDELGQVPVVHSRVAPEFFQLLGIKPALGRLPVEDANYKDTGTAVLSYEFWQTHFAGDRHVLGRSIALDGHPKTIIGVLPQNFAILSSSAAVWTPLDEATLRFSNFINRVGGVARLKNGATAMQLRADLLDRSENAGYRFASAPMQVTSLKSQSRVMLLAYSAFILLALGCAAGISWMLRSGAGGFGPIAQERGARLRWWGFFAAKSAALVGTAYCICWIAVHRGLGVLAHTVYPLADEIAIWAFLPVAVTALCWSIADQQKRCRVCLSRLGMAIDIGRPGSVLLNWAGTEMVCPQGHGTLYMPESESNSLQRDRWNSLDDSWAELFRAG
jgi:hypothetical protein